MLCVFRFYYFSLISYFDRYHYRFFYKVCCTHHRICMHFSVLMNMLYSLNFFFSIGTCFEIWIFITVFNTMTNLFTANTFQISQHPLFFDFYFGWISKTFLFIIILGFMHSKFATWLIFTTLPTTPPHFTTPFRLMYTT